MGGKCFKGGEMHVCADSSPEQIATFVKNIRPLDLIVFKGAEGVSNLIRKIEKCKTSTDSISHVEVAITREWCSRIRPIRAKTSIVDTDNTLLSWGSTLSGKLNDGVNDAETGGVKFGVQVRVLEDLVREYLKCPDANVGVCRLVHNPTEGLPGETLEEYNVRAASLKEKINLAYDKYNGVGYDANFLSLLGAMFPALRPLRNASEDILGKFTDANNWLFCSEWAAVLYEAVGVIDDATDGVVDGKVLDPRNVVPVDFLGVDQDVDGIVIPICEIPPIWVKPDKK